MLLFRCIHGGNREKLAQMVQVSRGGVDPMYILLIFARGAWTKRTTFAAQIDPALMEMVIKEVL